MNPVNTMDVGFDIQAAWLRRFNSDAQNNLGMLAFRLKAALPDLVTIHEQKGFFSKAGKVTGVSLELGEHRYRLELQNGRLCASMATVVRGITLNTKMLAPAEWFARLSGETQQASVYAQSLNASLQQFMAS